MDESTALVPFESRDPRDRALVWSRLPAGERRRAAMEAAANHDAAALAELLTGYMYIKSRMHTAVSPKTLKSYLLSLRDLLAAWQQENLLHPSADAGDRYVAALTGRLGPASVAARLHGCKAIYRALRWARATEADPFSDVHAPRNPTPPHERRRPYSDADVESLLDVAGDADRVLILLCAHGGLRISEALALEWRRVDVVGATLRVVAGKGGAARTVHLSESLRLALIRLARAGIKGPVIATAYGTPFRDPTVPRARLQEICRRAGVHYLGFHALRHSAGTRLVRQVGDLQIVAAHLGHKSVLTSAIYAKWSDGKLASAVAEW